MTCLPTPDPVSFSWSRSSVRLSFVGRLEFHIFLLGGCVDSHFQCNVFFRLRPFDLLAFGSRNKHPAPHAAGLFLLSARGLHGSSGKHGSLLMDFFHFRPTVCAWPVWPSLKKKKQSINKPSSRHCHRRWPGRRWISRVDSGNLCYGRSSLEKIKQKMKVHDRCPTKLLFGGELDVVFLGVRVSFMWPFHMPNSTSILSCPCYVG